MACSYPWPDPHRDDANVSIHPWLTYLNVYFASTPKFINSENGNKRSLQGKNFIEPFFFVAYFGWKNFFWTEKMSPVVS